MGRQGGIHEDDEKKEDGVCGRAKEGDEALTRGRVVVDSQWVLSSSSYMHHLRLVMRTL